MTVARPSQTDILGAAEGQLRQWQDRRKGARAKAKEQTDAAREGAIAALARKSRVDARARGAKRYVGMPCERHDSAERYVATGQCVFCDAEWTSARRGKPRSFGRLRGSIHRVRPMTSHRPQTIRYAKPGAWPVLLLDGED